MNRRLAVKQPYLELVFTEKYKGVTLREAMRDIFQAHYDVYVERSRKGLLTKADYDDLRLALKREKAGVVTEFDRDMAYYVLLPLVDNTLA